jgi:hypothetical protein
MGRPLHKEAASTPAFEDIKTLVRETGDTALLKKLDQFVGAAMIVSAAATGQPGILALLGPKDELIKIGEKVVAKLTGRHKENFLERHLRMTAAYQIVIYVAFFEAAADVLTDVRESLNMAASEKPKVAERLVASGQRSSEPSEAEVSDHQVHRALTLPHPVEGLSAKNAQLSDFYGGLARGLAHFIDCLALTTSDDARVHLSEKVEVLPALAIERQEAQFFALASEFHYFSTWLSIHNAEVTKEQLAQIDVAVRKAITKVHQTESKLDVGLAQLGKAIGSLPSATRREDAERITAGLAKAYERLVQERIIEDRLQNGEGGALRYPRKIDAFVPQAFKLLRANQSSAPALRLEDEGAWSTIPPSEDLGSFLKAYLDSPYSVEAPLVILWASWLGQVSADIYAGSATRISHL